MKLKFRAWDGEKYHYQDDQYLTSFLRRFISSFNWKNEIVSEHESYLKDNLESYLELSSGLTDSSGTEIYHNDRVVYEGEFARIEFDGVKFKIVWERECALSDKLRAWHKYVQVIGNVNEFKRVVQ